MQLIKSILITLNLSGCFFQDCYPGETATCYCQNKEDYTIYCGEDGFFLGCERWCHKR
jgi:hypothetical protein